MTGHNAFKPPVREPIDLRPNRGLVASLLGGPVPIYSPTGIKVGTYDRQIASIGVDMMGKAAAVAPFVDPRMWATRGLAAATQSAVRAAPVIASRRATRVAPGQAGKSARHGTEGHHLEPQFMGGPKSGPKLSIPTNAHIDYHRELGRQMKNPGALKYGRKDFPLVRGNGGSKDDWKDYLKELPARRDDALALLRSTARVIDRRHGTSIGKELDRIMKPSEGRGRNAAVLAVPYEAYRWQEERKK